MNLIVKETKINMTKTPYLLSLFVVMLSLLSILISFSVILSTLQNNARNNFYDTYGNSKVFKIKDIATNDIFDNKFTMENIEKISGFYTTLEDRYNFIIQVNQGFEAPYYEHLKDFMNKNSYSGDYDSVIYKSLRVNEHFFQFYDIKINDGRKFENNDYFYAKGDNVPIILGSKYKNYFKIGEAIFGNYMMFSNDTKYEIVGFLENDSKVFDFGLGSYIDLSDYIIIPSVILDSENAAFEQMIIANYSQIIPNTIITNENIEHDLEKLISNFGFNEMYEVENQSETVEEIWQTYSNVHQLIIGFLIFISFFCIALVISTYVQRIDINFERYAIHIALGASKNNIIKMVINDIFVLLLISNIINFAILIIINNIISFQFDQYIIRILTSILLYDLSIGVICYLVVYFKIKKLKLGEFMRRLQS